MRTASSLLLFVLGGVAITLAIGRKPASAAPLSVAGQEHTATDTNRTNQGSDSQATTKQANVDLPVNVLSWGAHGVAVGQSAPVDTTAYADNTYSTDQKVDQDRKADVSGSRGTSHDTPNGPGNDQATSAANDNDTEQRANASAETPQLNVNAPVSLLDVGSTGGDVRLVSGLHAVGGASNSDDTDHKVWSKGSSGARINQSQDATNQTRDANASTGQVSVRASVGCEHPNPRPQRLSVPEAPTVTQTQTGSTDEAPSGCEKSHGSGHGGGVRHAYAANTAAYAGNAAAGQSLEQLQEALISRR